MRGHLRENRVREKAENAHLYTKRLVVHTSCKDFSFSHKSIKRGIDEQWFPTFARVMNGLNRDFYALFKTVTQKSERSIDVNVTKLNQEAPILHFDSI